jgi:hypothetical protein
MRSAKEGGEWRSEDGRNGVLSPSRYCEKDGDGGSRDCRDGGRLPEVDGRE